MQIYANESCLTALFELFIQVDRKGGEGGVTTSIGGSRRIVKDLEGSLTR